MFCFASSTKDSVGRFMFDATKPGLLMLEEHPSLGIAGWFLCVYVCGSKKNDRTLPFRFCRKSRNRLRHRVTRIWYFRFSLDCEFSHLGGGEKFVCLTYYDFHSGSTGRLLGEVFSLNSEVSFSWLPFPELCNDEKTESFISSKLSFSTFLGLALCELHNTYQFPSIELTPNTPSGTGFSRFICMRGEVNWIKVFLLPTHSRLSESTSILHTKRLKRKFSFCLRKTSQRRRMF